MSHYQFACLLGFAFFITLGVGSLLTAWARRDGSFGDTLGLKVVGVCASIVAATLLLLLLLHKP